MCMISEQVKKLREIADGINEETRRFTHWSAKRLILEAANTIEILSAKLAAANMQNDSGWIACEDRLPEENGYYEATVQSIINNEAIRTTEQRCYHKKEKYFASLINPEFDIDEEVIAWRDMPQPYYQ